MKIALKQAFDTEMAEAISRYRQRQWDAAFRHLEAAHVLGQRHVMPHVTSHWWMLKIGMQRRCAPEVAGQAMRILAGAVGSAIGIVPTGNTGGTNISMFKRQPIDPAILGLIK